MTFKQTASLEEILKFLNLNQTQLCDILFITDTGGKCISESLVISLKQVIQQAITVLEDEDHASHWLKTPRSYFNGAMPLSLIITEEGTAEVLDLLGRIEHGVFS